MLMVSSSNYVGVSKARELWNFGTLEKETVLHFKGDVCFFLFDI